MIKYINPIHLYKLFKSAVTDLYKYNTYRDILMTLYSSGELERIGFKNDKQYNLYVGVDLNPELLLYADTSQESVELKMVTDKMKRYNDFLLSNGILDSIKVEYDRVKEDDYYGYIIKISYNFTDYTRFNFIYPPAYATFLASLISILLYFFT